MAYEEPGVKVFQQLALAAANIAEATQAVTLVGELYELFEDESAGKYDPVTGAGSQSFPWPGKLTTSVVDLAGVRKSIAEPDSQLQESAPFPLTFRLRDPVTSVLSDVNSLTDVSSVDQTDFTVSASSSAAAARLSGSNASAAQSNRFHVRTGGAVSAGVSVGDRIRVTNTPGSPTYDLRGKVTAFADDDVSFQADGTKFTLDALTSAGATTIVATVTDKAVTLPSGGTLRIETGSKTELVAYTGSPAVLGLVHTFTLVGATRLDHDAGVDVQLQVRDTETVSVNDADINTTSGHVLSTAGGFTSTVNDRIVVWPEEVEDDTGAVTGGGFKITTSGLALTQADVGKLATIWTDTSPLSGSDGDLDVVPGSLRSASATFVAADVGKVIKIGSSYRRITAITTLSGPGEVVYSGTALSGTGATFTVFRDQQVRTIMAVDVAGGGNDFWVNSSVTASGGGLPIVIHRGEHRDVTSVASDNDVVYSGSAISPSVGIGRHTPVRVYDERVAFQVMPDYDLLVTYRALNVSAVNDTLAVFTQSDIESLGNVDVNNPLLWAAQSALVAMGTDDTPILLQPINLYADTASSTGYPQDRDEVSGYLVALEVLSSAESPYFLVPLTRNSTVRDAFVSHVLAQSAATAKKERVCYLTYALPLGDFESTSGTIAPGLNAGNKLVSEPGAGFVSLHGVIPGNTVVITSPAAYAGSYVVASGSDDDNLVLESDNWRQDSLGNYVFSEFEVTDADTTVAGTVTTSTTAAWKDVEIGDYLLLGAQTRLITAVDPTFTSLTYAGTALPSGTGQTVSILRTSPGVVYHVRPLDKTEQAQALAVISQSRGSRRVVHMWPDLVEQVTGTDAQGNEQREFVSSIFSAAAEAGRDSVLEPERSSTGAALAGFTGLRNSNKYFNLTQLNTIAGGGWTILEQREAGAAVKVRHLLTTDMSTVKNQELSFTKNVDNMAKVKRASTEPLLNDDNGRVNISQDLLQALAFPFQGIYETFVRNNQLVRTEAGPPYTILSIRQDPLQPDNILEDAELNVPIPANRVVVTFIL